MLKKYFTLFLTIGFFALLQSAVADGPTTIIHNAPADVRLPQTTDDQIILLTLRADNIQVQERWTVRSSHPLTISNDGELKTDGDIEGVPQILATVVLEDLFTKLNDNYDNLSVQVTITINVISGFYLADATNLKAIFGKTVTLHTFTANTDDPADNITYSLVNDHTSFAVDNDGVFVSYGTAEEGQHTLTIQAETDALNTQAIAIVQIFPTLSLANAPPLFASIGEITDLYTFTVAGGVDNKTYTLQTAIPEYFDLHKTDGVLSLSDDQTLAGIHILTIRATDESDNYIDAYATVRVTGFILADAPRLNALEGQNISLHTFTVNTDETAPVNYSLVNGDDEFAIDHDGIFSSPGRASVGLYTLTIQAQASTLTAHAVATVEIFPALSLADAPSLSADVGTTPTLHIFTAAGGINNKTYTLLAATPDHFGLGETDGVLSLVDDQTPGGIYILTIRAIDEGRNEIDAYATVHITGFFLADVLTLRALFGQDIILHTFDVITDVQEAVTYSLVNDNGLFDLDETAGTFSSPGLASVGIYTLTIRAATSTRDTHAIAMVQIFPTLSLADAPPLFAEYRTTANLHTFTATGGIYNKTYTLIAATDYFSLEPDSGVLSLVDHQATIDIYTLTIRAIDADSNFIDAQATVHITGFVLADAPSVQLLFGHTGPLHTFAVTTHETAVLTYSLVDNLTVFGIDNNGVFSLSNPVDAGRYTLTIQAEASTLTAYAVATVEIFPTLSLSSAPYLVVQVGDTPVLHTFIAAGGIDNKTYTLQTAITNYFYLDEITGELSLIDDQADPNIYVLTIRASDERSNAITVLATVHITDFSLADAPFLKAIIGVSVSLHTFAITTSETGVINYSLVSNTLFGIDQDGIFSSFGTAPEGLHTLTIRAEVNVLTVHTIATVEMFPALSLSDAPSLFAKIGDTVTLYTFTAEGGIEDKTYAMQTAIPDYFALNSTIGALSFMAPQATVGEHILTIIATDEGNNAITVYATVQVINPLVLVDLPLLRRNAGTMVSIYTFMADGGFGDKTYTIIAGNDDFMLRDGLLSVSVSIAVGNYPLTIAVADRAIPPNGVTVSLTVQIFPAFSLADAPSLVAKVGDTLSLHMFTAEGGVETKTYALYTAKPNYFSLNPANGVLSLFADEAPEGVYILTIRATDEGNNLIDAYATVQIFPVLSLPGPAQELLSNTGRTRVLHTLTAIGGIPNITYMLQTAITNNYFDLNQDGVLSLVDDEIPSGVYTLTIIATDKRNDSVTAYATVQIDEFLLADAPPLYAIVSVSIALHTFEAVVDEGTTVNYTVLDDTTLFGIDQDGVFSSFGLATVGLYTLTIQAEDNDSTAQAKAIVQIVPTLSLADAPSLFAVVDITSTLHTFTAEGGILRKTYTLQTATPEHFTLDEISGELLFVAKQATVGFYVLTIHALDEYRNAIAAYATVQVFPALSLSDAPLLFADVGTTLSLHTFTAAGGIKDKTYTLIADTSDYFFVDEYFGVLSLVNSETPVGAYTLTIRAIDQGNNHIDAFATVQVINPLVWVPTPPIDRITGAALSLTTFMTEGGFGDKTYMIIGGDGTFTVRADGVLSVSVSIAPGDYTVTIDVADSATPRNRITASVTVHIFPDLSLTDAPSLFAQVNTTLSLHTFTADGGIRDKTYTLIDATDYFALASNMGVLSLTNHQAPVGVYPLAIRARDKGGNAITAYATVYITDFSLADAPPLRAIIGPVVTLHRFTVISDVTVSVTYSLRDNTQFDIDPDGTFSFLGQATEGRHTLTIQAQFKALNAHAVATVEIFAALSLADAPPLGGKVGDTLSLHTFTAEGGIRDKTYALETAITNYFTLGSTNGILSLFASPDSDGVYLLTIIVTDQDNNVMTAYATVRISPALGLTHVPLIQGFTGAKVSLYTFISEGGDGEKTYTIIDDDGTFTVRDGVLSVLVSLAPGDYALTIELADSASNLITASFTVQIVPHVSLVNIPPLFFERLSEGKTADFYTVVATGGIGSKTYEWDTNTKRDYTGLLWLNLGTGVLSFAVVSPEIGTHFLTIIATDERGNSDSTVATLNMINPLNLDNLSLIEKITAATLSLTTFIAKGGFGDKVYTVIRNDNTFTADANGVLAAFSPADGEYILTIEVADRAIPPNRITVSLTVHIFPVLSLADAPYLVATVDTTLSLHTFAADGGIYNKTYTLPPATPNYFELGRETGVLSLFATPDSVGRHTLTIHANDQNNNRITALATIYITDFSLADATLLLRANFGVSISLYTFTITTSETGTISYALVNNTLFGIDDDGVFSSFGVAEEGRYTLTIRAEINVLTAYAKATVRIFPALVFTAVPSSVLLANFGAMVSLYTFVAEGGIEGKTYTLPSATPNYFAVGPETGILSLVAEAPAESYILTIRATDEGGNYLAAAATVSIIAQLVLHTPPIDRTEGSTVLHTFITEGGYGDKTYTLIANGGESFTLDDNVLMGDNGNIPLGTYTLAIAVEDTAFSAAPPNRITALVTVRILPPSLLYMLGGREVKSNFGLTFVPALKKIWSSPDGDGWQSETDASWAARSGHQAIVHQEKIYVIGGERSDSGLSSRGRVYPDVWSYNYNGSTWKLETNQAEWAITIASGNGLNSRQKAGRGKQAVVSHNGTMYAIGGESIIRYFEEDYDGDQVDVWSSVDGMHWTEILANSGWGARDLSDAPYPVGDTGGPAMNLKPHENVCSLSYYASYDQCIYTSNLLPSNYAHQRGRYGHKAVVYRDRIYLTGGEIWKSFVNVEIFGDLENKSIELSLHTTNDVWSSADGINWRLETANAKWPARTDHGFVVHNDIMYIMGGERNKVWLNDVWSSQDGINWTQKNSSAWDERSSFSVQSFGDNLYVIGGREGPSGFYDDVWSSADGANWTKKSNFPLRIESSQAVVYPPPLELLGVDGILTAPSNADVGHVIHKFTARYGRGALTYSIDNDNFKISNDGVLSLARTGSGIGGNPGAYKFTVSVIDEEGGSAKTGIEVRVN